MCTDAEMVFVLFKLNNPTNFTIDSQNAAAPAHTCFAQKIDNVPMFCFAAIQSINKITAN